MSNVSSPEYSGRRADNCIGISDDFEVAIFLTEPSTRHSLLIKQRYLKEPRQRLRSNSRKLTDPANDHTDGSETRQSSPIVLREDEEEGNPLDLREIPLAPAEEASWEGRPDRRRRNHLGNEPSLQRDRDSPSEVIDLSEGDDMSRDRNLQSKRQQSILSDMPELAGEDDDKKKLFISSSYDGFSIYGRILCLIVKRRQGTNERSGINDSQAMMENWIRSTQLDSEDA